MPRVGTCLIDGFEDYEDKLIDHLEKEHADLNRRLSVDGWHDWLKRNTKVEERLLPPGANPWIRRQYSSKIQTGIGAVEPETLR
ncbi:hypothetical protein E6H15_00950 [Candidatus Bathyarchaeota archaeon]|nr:MAG: hypothetical protein E6H22_05720 [Candidatus Bathyarchaeota archaeon]TMI56512.1 MAG: hypothetical protein E6H15_00950 [Candidatus Bathyarchaeota archaeon]